MTNFVEWSDIDYQFKKKNDGEVDIVKGENAINQSIKLMFSTLRGERVRSDLGSGFYYVLFEPMSEDTAEELHSIITTTLPRYENRISLERVSVIPHYEDNFYEIRISYLMLPSRARKNLTTFVPSLGVN